MSMHHRRLTHLTLVVALTVTTLLGVDVAIAQAPQRIQREQIDAMFSQMRSKAPWDVNGPLLWGYFFFDSSQEKLRSAASELSAKGYSVVGIDPVRAGMFRLHVERVEVHTPASLDARNQEFYALADRLKISSYDGMDVGPAGPLPKK